MAVSLVNQIMAYLANSGNRASFIRHIASGREAYVQGGPDLRAFFKACLLQGSKPETKLADPDTTGKSTLPSLP